MQKEVLQNRNNIMKIFLIYKDSNGIKKKEKVSIRFMDKKKCYLSGSIPVHFNKPKRKTDAELTIYTEEGVYKTTVKIHDTTLSMNEILYEVDVPKKYDFIQLRSSSRKQVKLPVTLKFNDGFEVKGTTFDLSLGGISFYSEEKLSSLQQKFSCIATIDFPNSGYINFPENKLVTEAKFVRQNISEEYSMQDQIFYVFKFMKLTSEELMILKNFLLKIES